MLVSDFYSLRYFDPVAAPGVRYSFTGAIQKPRQVLRGGYLSWHDVASDTWWQETWFDGNAPAFRSLGQLNAQNGNIRSQVDRLTTQATSQAQAGGFRATQLAGLPTATIDRAGMARASNLRRQIDGLVGKSERPNYDGERAKSAQAAEANDPAAQAARRRDIPRSNGQAGLKGLRATPSLRAMD